MDLLVHGVAVLIGGMHNLGHPMITKAVEVETVERVLGQSFVQFLIVQGTPELLGV